MKKTVLITGGAGYIGSHTCVELLHAGYGVVVVDNYVNSSPEVFDRVERIAGARPVVHCADIRDEAQLDAVFREQPIDAVIHFGGLKAVGESLEIPLDYYHNNVIGTLSLCRSMRRNKVFNLVFSSSATVYGAPRSVPIREDFPTSATNPYGRSKLMIEDILRDVSAADASWNISILRYFNPVGAHSSGLIGESPKGIPNNIAPSICQVASGRLPAVSVFGNDYPTPDGTGVRDYIHIMDLAAGHVKALDKLFSGCGLMVHNLGTGRGHSVLEMIRAFEKASGRTVPYTVVGRRPGDVAECYADASRARDELGWEAKRSLVEMAEDAWRWQMNNPEGYSTP